MSASTASASHGANKGNLSGWVAGAVLIVVILAIAVALWFAHHP